MKRYLFLLYVCFCVVPVHTAAQDEQLLDEEQVWRKIKLIPQLWVDSLTVTQRLVVNGHEITGQANSSGISSYGQLSVTTQEIIIETADDFQAIPFNIAGPTSNMSASTTSPATITIGQDGVYQLTFSLYFSAEDPDEGSFNTGTYTLGLNINGVTTSVAAVYAGDPGQFSLNYSSIMNLAAGDEIQWYLKASTAHTAPFDNNVTLEHGYAYVMQIGS